jgi:hypothetical protein
MLIFLILFSSDVVLRDELPIEDRPGRLMIRLLDVLFVLSLLSFIIIKLLGRKLAFIPHVINKTNG